MQWVKLIEGNHPGLDGIVRVLVLAEIQGHHAHLSADTAGLYKHLGAPVSQFEDIFQPVLLASIFESYERSM